MDTIILKCETQKLMSDLDPKSKRNVWDLLLSVATTYSYDEDRYRLWTFSQKDDLNEYLKNKYVVGFGCVNFDLPLLYGNVYQCSDEYEICVKDGNDSHQNGYVFDLYFNIIMSIYHCNRYSEIKDVYHKNPIPNNEAYNLKNISCATLGRTDNLEHSNNKSTQLFKTKKILELVEFGLFKVRIVKRLYEFMMKYGYVVNGTYDIVKIRNNIFNKFKLNLKYH